MKKVVKTTLGIFVGIAILVAVLVVGTMFLLTNMIQPTTFKEQFAKAVYLKTGRQLTINGDIKMELFPRVSIVASDTTLSNAPYFNDRPFAHVDSIEIQVSILPLLVKKIMVDKFVFKNCVLNLARDHTGVSNWDDVIGVGTDTVNAADRGESLLGLYASNVEVDNATINFDDQQYEKKLTLSAIKLRGQDINLRGGVFGVNIQGVLHNDDHRLNITSNFTLNGNVVLDCQKKIYAIKGLQITGDAVGAPLLRQIKFSVGADIDSDFNKQEITVNNLRFQLANLVAVGQMRAINIIYAPDVLGSIDIATFDPKPLLYAFGFINDIQAVEHIWHDAAIKATIQTTSKFLKVPNLELSLNGAIISGSASYSHFGDKLVVLNLDVNDLDLDRYRLDPMPKVMPSVVKPQSFYDRLKQSFGQKTTQNLGHDAVIAVASEAKHAKGNTSVKSKGQQEEKNVLFSILRGIVLNGDLQIHKLKLGEMRFKNVKMQISSGEGHEGIIDLNPITSDFYDGTIKGEIKINVSKNIPSFSCDGKIANFVMQQLVHAVAKIDKLSGMATAKLKLTTLGNKAETLLKNLQGTGSIYVMNGAFHGIDIRYQIERAKGLIGNSHPSMQETKPPKTVFNQFKSSFKITDGTIDTRDLLLQAPKFKIKGAGRVNLVAQNLDLQLDAAYADYGAFYIPIKVTGSFAAPSVKPDVAMLMGRLLKGAVVQTVKEPIGVGLHHGKIDADKVLKAIKIDDKKILKFLSQ